MTTPEELRRAARRARDEAIELRRLAGRLDASHVHQLSHLAGDDTWLGPTATAFQDVVRRSRAELDAAAADLRRQAAQLERDADGLDRVAAQASFAAELVRVG